MTGAARQGPIELSLVIPVYNGSATVGPVVERIHAVFAGTPFEVVLVNDGSTDASERTCSELVERHPETVRFVQLSRNFGEHSAVLAGLNHAAGRYAAVLDDDGQNPPEEVPRMLAALKERRCDVVYGRYVHKRHHWMRNLASRFTNRVATAVLHKPPDLYLSSFKVMDRFVVDEVIRYRGAFPYIDGLVFRVTRNVAQVDVEHRPRAAGRSGYTLRRLVHLWLNMCLNYSVTPLRIATVVGSFATVASVLLVAGIVVDKLLNPDVTHGIPTVLVLMTFFAGVELVLLGVIGEYLGRLLLDHSGTPQFIVRYVRSGPDAAP
jgi:glycosyltransferase involved in cell wall biosynthesis